MKVEPIRDKEVLDRLVAKLAEDESTIGRRRYIMFLTGIYLGRRISDMAQLRVGDVLGRDSIIVKEKKTGKSIELPIPAKLKKAYKDHLTGHAPDEWLLQSTRKDWITGKPRPITNSTALRDMHIIQEAAKLEGVRIGTHTMRKTFGYHYYRATQDIAGLMSLFNHSKEEVTLIYIGITMDDRKKMFSVVNRMYDT